MPEPTPGATKNVSIHYGGSYYRMALPEDQDIADYLSNMATGDRGRVLEVEDQNGRPAFLVYTKGTPLAMFEEDSF